ncbi:MAG: ATP-binding protein [Ignavibacteriaceae bacterium]|nr:ATP-binding protein [Ignavibacteriaceae bacterium]
MIPRHITPKIHLALKHRPIVYIQGGRQTGKSTLARNLLSRNYKAEYISLDDLALLAVVKNDPKGFLNSYPGNLIIDEVQMAPDLLIAIKHLVDQDRKPGRFVLTGSSNLFTLPKISESLAGRVDIYRLLPFAQSEIDGKSFHLIDELFRGRTKTLFDIKGKGKQNILKRIIRGGFPEIVLNRNTSLTARWFNSYVTTLLQRDVRDIASIDNLEVFPQLLGILASRSGGLTNFADISRETGVPQTTLKRYISILRMAFIVELVPSWSNKMEQRFVKAPKIFFNDSGLLSYLCGYTEKRFDMDNRALGMAMENFVFAELVKLQSFSDNFFTVYHYRTHLDEEIDFILERNDGSIIAVEVKASETIKPDMVKHIKSFRSKYPDKFLSGVVFYSGKQVIPLGDKMYAVPVDALWGG